jgi:cysteine synthase
MEKLTINIPNNKSSLVKQILKELGVTIENATKADNTSYKEKLTRVSNWSEHDVKVFEQAKSAFDNLKTQEW